MSISTLTLLIHEAPSVTPHPDHQTSRSRYFTAPHSLLSILQKNRQAPWRPGTSAPSNSQQAGMPGLGPGAAHPFATQCSPVWSQGLYLFSVTHSRKDTTPCPPGNTMPHCFQHRVSSGSKAPGLLHSARSHLTEVPACSQGASTPRSSTKTALTDCITRCRVPCTTCDHYLLRVKLFDFCQT